tara:strand:+ start:314 stop:517 length:204 start_codon:yes stop_codon:yes gene_type:complete
MTYTIKNIGITYKDIIEEEIKNVLCNLTSNETLKIAGSKYIKINPGSDKIKAIIKILKTFIKLNFLK